MYHYALKDKFVLYGLFAHSPTSFKRTIKTLKIRNTKSNVCAVNIKSVPSDDIKIHENGWQIPWFFERLVWIQNREIDRYESTSINSFHY